jgi:hypothetical protein
MVVSTALQLRWSVRRNPLMAAPFRLLLLCDRCNGSRLFDAATLTAARACAVGVCALVTISLDLTNQRVTMLLKSSRFATVH